MSGRGDTYQITITILNVADGDIAELSRELDALGEDYDADRGEFDFTISKNGFPFDPTEEES